MELPKKMQNKYEILTSTGWSDFHGVRKQLATGIVTLSFDNGETLECSLDHKLELKCGFEEVKNLSVGDEIRTATGWAFITFYYKDLSESAYVYDALEVEGNNTYITNNIVSHNCQFLGSSGTLISGTKLKELDFSRPIVEKDGLCQYERPNPGSTYVMTVDVSRGKGLDYSTFNIIDVTQMPYKQVCTYRENFIGPVDFASIIFRMGKFYNEAAVLVEINDIGEQVSDTLTMDYGYENMLFTENAGRSGKRISSGFGKRADNGIRTTKTVKSVGCSMLKMLIEQNQLIIQDYNTIQELSRFSRKAGSYEAESGWYDDLVMNLVLFAWLSDQAFFKEMTDINTLSRLREKTDQEIEDDLLPFGFIDSGPSDHEVVKPGFQPVRDNFMADF
jgi:hypothetical protein